MLWYLLYPIRGTTDPPRLPSEHPVRRAFYRHGLLTARHWLLAMLVTVAIGTIFTYPVVFLSDFPTAGLSGLPHHVWASHKPYEGAPDRVPDLEMRQIWIHGSYMQALNKDVLHKALMLQNSILGEATDPGNKMKSHGVALDWGYHSPLMHWNNSFANLENDLDVVRTVNEYACHPSFLNFTLRPLSVFSGKSFSGAKLNAADALVISLFNRINDTIGEIWQRNMQKVLSQTINTSVEYQSNGTPNHSRLYEYRFQPLNIRQHFALAIAYGIIAVYVTVSLLRLKAFHSRFGLVVTALTQMTTSILASFTVCGLLKINLAQIPQEAYPFVVVVIGLENIFRLINAVLAYPAEMMNTQRIANGLGDIGHASVASAAQNLLILWLLSLVVSPGVAAFCAFAAVALIFDYFFLFTFFVAVLNVDIRRLELQDSIRASHSHRVKRKTSAEHHTWLDALIQGRVPFSTRMAGSVVTISFVMVLNWHLTDHGNPATPSKAFPGLFEKQHLPITEFDGTALVQTDPTRARHAWLRTQDYENAVHFMKVVKPDAYGFLAKIFDPLVIVLSGSDRSGVPLFQESWLVRIRSLAVHHFYPVTLAAVFVVAFVTVLMNFLLWDQRAEGAESETSTTGSSPLAVETLHTPHTLDIVKIAGCKQGHIVSAGLDRTLSILLYDFVSAAYRPVLLSEDQTRRIKWPIHECCIDERGEWLALVCGDEQILLGNLHTGDLGIESRLDARGRTLAYAFFPHTKGTSKDVAFVMIDSHGTLVEYSSFDNVFLSRRLVDGDIVAASLSTAESGDPQLLLCSASGQFLRYKKMADGWTLHSKAYPELGESPSERTLLSVTAIPGLMASVLLCGSTRLLWLRADPAGGCMSESIKVKNAKPSSLRTMHSGDSVCPNCKKPTVSTISFAYVDSETKDCVIHTISPQLNQTKLLNIFLQGHSCDCVGPAESDKVEYALDDPGAWEATTEAVVGIRKRPNPRPVISPEESRLPRGMLRRRKNTTSSEDSIDEAEQWDAYMFSASGGLQVVGIDCSPSFATQLYTTKAGPACRLGPRSVAIALGNRICVIQHGVERVDKGLNGVSDGSSQSVPARRKLISKKC